MCLCMPNEFINRELYVLPSKSANRKSISLFNFQKYYNIINVYTEKNERV